MSDLFPVRFLFHPSVSAQLRGSCGARRLRSFCFAYGPVPVLGAAPTRFRVPETDGHNRTNICTSTESLSLVSSAVMPKGRSATQPTSRCSRLPPRPRGRMTLGRGNPGRSGIDASPSASWPSSPPRSGWVRTLPSRANCAGHEYPREIAVGPQTTSIPQRVWEIRVNSVLKLDRAAHRGSHDDSHEEAPVKGRFLGCWEMSTHRTTSWESTLPRPFSPSADRHRPSGMAPTHGERNRRKLDHSLPLRIPPEIAYGSSPLCLGAASWAATGPRRGPSRSIGIEVEEVTRYILKLGNAQSLSGNVAATATGRLLRMEDETCSARP
jgi:hypothetical protein